MTRDVLATAEVDHAYDVHGPLPPADRRPLLVMIVRLAGLVQTDLVQRPELGLSRGVTA